MRTTQIDDIAQMDKTGTKANPTTGAVLALVALTLVTPLTLVILPTVAPVSSAKRKAVAHGSTLLGSKTKSELGSSPET
jgi:hypothetical protein